MDAGEVKLGKGKIMNLMPDIKGGTINITMEINITIRFNPILSILDTIIFFGRVKFWLLRPNVNKRNHIDSSIFIMIQVDLQWVPIDFSWQGF